MPKRFSYVWGNSVTFQVMYTICQLSHPITTPFILSLTSSLLFITKHITIYCELSSEPTVLCNIRTYSFHVTVLLFLLFNLPLVPSPLYLSQSLVITRKGFFSSSYLLRITVMKFEILICCSKQCKGIFQLSLSCASYL